MKFQAFSIGIYLLNEVVLLIAICYINITTLYELFGVKAFQYFQSVHQFIFKRKIE